VLDNEIVAERAREVGEQLRHEARSIDPVEVLLAASLW
jgi:hypothetical protein